MVTRTRKAKVLFLDDRIEILNRDAVEVSAKHVFRTAGAALALVLVPPFCVYLWILIDNPYQDKMIDDKDSVQPSEFQRLQSVEDCRPGKEWGWPQRVCEGGTRGFGKVC